MKSFFRTENFRFVTTSVIIALSWIYSGVAPGGGAIAPPGSILALKKYTFSLVTVNAKHEFHETCHSFTFLFQEIRLQTMLWHHNARVNSHQRWKQTRFCVCFHLWCELTSTMNVTEWQASWNSCIQCGTDSNSGRILLGIVYHNEAGPLFLRMEQSRPLSLCSHPTAENGCPGNWSFAM